MDPLTLQPARNSIPTHIQKHVLLQNFFCDITFPHNGKNTHILRKNLKFTAKQTFNSICIKSFAPSPITLSLELKLISALLSQG